MKHKSFCIAKEIIDKMKMTYWIGENICKWFDWQGINIEHM